MEAKIKKFLQKEYDNHVNVHGENHILGTFTVGLANYGYAENLSEFEFITVYLPKFEDLCTGDLIHNGTATMLGRLYDIRNIYDVVNKHGSKDLELLFSNNYIINPKYESIYNTYFKDKRELIAHVNKKERISKAYERAKEAFDNNDIFEGMRLYFAVSLYLENKSCDECFHITDKDIQDLLWRCKKGTFQCNKTRILTTMKYISDSISDKINHDTDSIIKHGVVALMEASMHSNI